VKSKIPRNTDARHARLRPELQRALAEVRERCSSATYAVIMGTVDAAVGNVESDATARALRILGKQRRDADLFKHQCWTLEVAKKRVGPGAKVPALLWEFNKVYAEERTLTDESGKIIGTIAGRKPLKPRAFDDLLQKDRELRLARGELRVAGRPRRPFGFGLRTPRPPK
jgi:hypothetical protein